MSAGAPSATSEDLILAEQLQTAQRLQTNQQLLLQLPLPTATIKEGPENLNGLLFPLQEYSQVCTMYFRFSAYSTKVECGMANSIIRRCRLALGYAELSMTRNFLDIIWNRIPAIVL